MSKNNRLTDKSYWDSVLSDVSLPRINSPMIYNYYVTMRFLDPVLSGMKNKRLLEIGAGSSGWLPYFAQKYGLKVSGLDYSAVGCRIAEENLKLLGIDYEEIICADLFEWKGEKQYDVIFSYGVIEHFDNPEEIIRICYNHLSPNGIIITLVPNIQGVVRTLSRQFINNVYKMHKIFTKSSLRTLHESMRLMDIKTDYVGTFSLSVIPWTKTDFKYFDKKVRSRCLFIKCIYSIDLLLSKVLLFTKINLPSRIFSPYIISIMRK